MAYSSFKRPMVRFGSVINVVSVTSNSKHVGETPCLRNTLRQRAMKLACLSWRSERLMAIRPGSGTVFCHSR